MQTDSDVLFDQGFADGKSDALAEYPWRPLHPPIGEDPWTRGWWAGVRAVHENKPCSPPPPGRP